jgi:hypothetical protein
MAQYILGVKVDLTQLTTDGDLVIKGYLATVPAYQTVYLADGRPDTDDIHTSGYHKIDMVGTAVTGPITLTSPPHPFVLGELVIQTGSGTKGYFMETVGSGSSAVSYIYRVDPTDFDGTNPIVGQTGGSSIAPSAIVAPPHWMLWTPLANEFSPDEAGGHFPDGGSNIGALYNGRIFLNSLVNPNQWFCSRQGFPCDWDTSLAGDDAGAAQSSQTTQAGLVGDAITAFMPFKDVYLGFGCASQIWTLVGDPGSGGSIRLITDETGVFGPRSWCKDSVGNVYVVGLDGFYKIEHNAMTYGGTATGAMVGGGAIDNVSLRLVPGLFKSIALNRKTDKVVMGFDKVRNLVHVAVSMQDGAWSVCWVYDVSTDSIWPDTFGTGLVPSSYLYFDAGKADERGLKVGCYDGYIREFNTTAKDDDGNIIGSSWLAAPINIESIIRAKGKIREIHVILSSATDSLSWAVYSAGSPEELVEQVQNGDPPVAFGEYTEGGEQFSIREKVTGHYLGILFYNFNLSKSWGVEEVALLVDYAGKEKSVE